MAFDPHKNLASSAVAVAPSPASSGLSLSVVTGEGARFPAAPFNVTISPKSVKADLTNAEIARCTERVGDVFTIVRAQEETVAREIIVGDTIALTVTAKSLQDIESGRNFSVITVGTTQDPGVGTTNTIFSVNGNMAFEGAGENYIGKRTSPGADTGVVTICGGGPTPGGTATANRGGAISVNGINNVGNPGGINMQAANNPGAIIKFQTNDTTRLTVAYDGGVMVGNIATPGANNLAVLGNVKAANLKWRQGHTFAVLGDVSALPNNGYLAGFFVPLVGTQTAKIVGMRARIHLGTSVNITVLQNDGITAVSGVITVNQTKTTTPLNMTLANEDEIILLVNGAVGAPTNLNVTLFVEYAL